MERIARLAWHLQAQAAPPHSGAEPSSAGGLSLTPADGIIGYVSDERYVATHDVLVLLEHESLGSVQVTSRADGSVVAPGLPPGDYNVLLRKNGYSPKRANVTLPLAAPFHFRLLSDGLVGYMWPKWTRSGGEESEFRVHCAAAEVDEQYRLDLYRYGLEKEHVRCIGWFGEHGPGATMQVTPDGDYTRTGAAFNRQGFSNNPHHRQTVEPPARSGLYYMHAESLSGKFFTFPWIIAPPQDATERLRPPVAVLLANMNWNAYNNWGGRSNYIHPVELPLRPGANSRFDLDRYTKMDAYMHFDAEEYAPLSFERPEPLNHVPKDTQVGDPLEGRSECHVAPAEWRLLGWLERERIEYDTYAETQLHFGDLVLDDYKILIISAHPEYWSHEMYFKLKRWVFERGGKLMYLGGNGLNCEVTFSDDGTAMTCCNGNRGGGASELKLTTARADGSEAPTGLESRFDYYFESEANLLGVRCTETGIMTSAPYRVVLPDHWIFAGTGLTQGEAFGEECLHRRCPGGASGHETDKMSPSSPPGTVLLARGTNDGAPTEPGQETGGAEMVLHETESGGAVFSVGSITYPCSLLVDTNISKVTLNVVKKFLG